jgi:predicted dehydrogenase
VTSVVAVIGVGQLGSRYLQGLHGVLAPLTIYGLDPNLDSLKVASERLGELDKTKRAQHSVIFVQDAIDLPQKLDLVIVATPADIRLNLAEQVRSSRHIDYWILEKLLSNRSDQILAFSEITRDAIGAWVNLPYRAMAWHQKLRESLRGKGPFQVEAHGTEYGLLTNAIHYVDLLTYWTDSKVESVFCRFGSDDFCASKRPGYVEAHGEIEVDYKDGSRLSLRSEKLVSESRVSQGLTMIVRSKFGTWKVNEEEGVFIEPNGASTKGRIEFQSEMTGEIVTKILENGRTDLPRLEETQASHILLLDAIQEVWSERNSELEWVPIT